MRNVEGVESRLLLDRVPNQPDPIVSGVSEYEVCVHDVSILRPSRQRPELGGEERSAILEGYFIKNPHGAEERRRICDHIHVESSPLYFYKKPPKPFSTSRKIFLHSETLGSTPELNISAEFPVPHSGRG